jgi:hypothetical protein
LNNKKVLCLIIAVLFILVAVLAIMLVLPENEENSKAESDISQTFDISEISREISESSSEEISESVSAEISEEESILPDISFVPAVSDEVSEPADTPSLPPEEETSTPDEVSEEPQVLITVPQITVPQVTGSAWDGSIATGFEKGSGTQADPYIISTASQLAFFQKSVNSGNDYEGKYILLSQSIRISDIDGTTVPDTSDILWEGIGTEFNPFRGTFNGNGNAVCGLYGDGLFGVISGNIQNVIIANSYVTSGGAVVATAMKNYEISDHDPIISGCAVINSTVCGIGGVVGYADGYSIISCSNFAPVNGNSEWVGGVVGEFAHGTMKNCYNVGSVSGGAMCGGIVGNGFNCNFEDCYNVGTVEGKKFSGGFAAVDYISTYKSCGYLETVSEYAYSALDGTYVKVSKGIIVFTQDEVG